MNPIKNTFHILIFFLISINQVFCQDQVKQNNSNGLSTTIFNMSLGKITVYIPEHAANETISGTIYIDPQGNSERKRQKNKVELKAYKLSLGNKSISLQSATFQLSAPVQSNNQLQLLNTKGKVIFKSVINTNPSNTTSRPTTYIPEYMVSGNPVKITSPCDGNLENNSLLINNTNVPILAESESGVFFKAPANSNGSSELIFTNEGTTIETSVHVLGLDLSVGRTNLMRGETTNLFINVSGLQGLETNVPMDISNNSPSNITLEGGNTQQLLINPSSDAPSGNYSTNLSIRALQRGGFSISVNIQPDELLQPDEDEPLCNCKIDEYSYLLDPESCQKLGGYCIDDTPIENTGTADSELNIQSRDFLYLTLFLSIDKDIEGLEDDILDKWEDYDKAKTVKEDNEKKHNALVSIDKVLDKVPETYKDKLKKVVDSLVKVRRDAPEVTDDVLQKAIDDAKARLEACKKRLEDLQTERQNLEKQLEADKEALEKAFEEYANILKDYNFELTYKFNEDGSFEYEVSDKNVFNYDRERIKDEQEFIDELFKEFLKKKKQYQKKLKHNKDIPEQIEQAQNDCDELSEALESAKEAKAKADLAAAVELEVEDVCKQIQRLLSRLYYWCKKNPEHCDFIDDIVDLKETYPKTEQELESFWEKFNELVKKKKALEDSFGKAAKEAQDEMDDIEDEVSGLEGEIKGLEERKRKREAKARKIAEEKAATAAAAAEEAKKRKAANDKKRREREKSDKKVKGLIKKARSDEAGDDAFKDLLEGMGLSLLDEASGNGKLGTIIGGLLAAKDIPDCTCPIIKALRDAISARNNGKDPSLYVEGYLQEWKKCANLPSFPYTTSAIGGPALTDAINNMTKAQTSRALKALNQAVRIQCK